MKSVKRSDSFVKDSLSGPKDCSIFKRTLKSEDRCFKCKNSRVHLFSKSISGYYVLWFLRVDEIYLKDTVHKILILRTICIMLPHREHVPLLKKKTAQVKAFWASVAPAG